MPDITPADSCRSRWMRN